LTTPETPFGPTGRAVYLRTYSRPKADGTYETWPETVARVARGNLSLVYGHQSTWDKKVWKEYDDLNYYMGNMAILPAGRQLWASGVPGRQFLFNCHVSGWGTKFSDHFAFTFMRLVEGGGVGANYSTRLFEHYGAPRHPVKILLDADESHPDYEKMRPYLLNKEEYDTAVARESRQQFRGLGYVEDTREGWAEALSEVIDYSMSVYGVEDRGLTLYFDLSKIRPEGSPLVSSGGVASGPAPLAKMLHDIVSVLNRAWSVGHFSPVDIMEMDHVISVGAIAGGKRRSARMSMCHWNDDFIMDFINAKADGSKFWTTNISVEIDNEFLEALDDTSGRGAWARKVHEAVCAAVLTNGEPGYWNSDLSNEGEPGTIIATNPCGEIPLEAWEACNLGHVNLDWFVNKDIACGFDPQLLLEAHRLVTRFLVRSTFGDITDPKQKVIQDRNRRIGVGHLGVQAFFAKSYELKYSEIAKQRDDPFISPQGLLRYLHHTVRQEASDYAFELRIPAPVKVTTVAPTGSVAKLPGTTEGISAIYARWFIQRVRFSLRDDREFEQVQQYQSQGFKVETDVYDQSGMTAVVCFPTENLLVSQMRDLGLSPDLIESQEQISLEDMLELQAFYQKYWADNAVSYTANVPEGTVTPEVLDGILRAYLPKLKGTTIMVDATREQAPYTRISEHEYTVANAKRVSDALDLECSTGACPIK
jgi:ribonucleoside-triphosphate reductase (thioredoxin)